MYHNPNLIPLFFLIDIISISNYSSGDYNNIYLIGYNNDNNIIDTIIIINYRKIKQLLLINIINFVFGQKR